MSETTSHPDHDSLPEAEVLISRLVDGEASAADRAQFEALASEDASLWSALARLQLAMQEIATDFDIEAMRIDTINLPRRRTSDQRGVLRSLMSYSGWAAAIVLAITLFTVQGSQSTSGDLMTVANEHLEFWLNDSPVVIGELRPHLSKVERLDDGRLRLRYTRRIEEVATIPLLDNLEEQIDDAGDLLFDPRKYHQPD